ncbi:cation:proton antiporter domain-containing protein [Paraglaciecola chathamensis]|uniref:Cation:proton antiporter n=3 Tax=Paraglaciecola chathamensis TaxID=368405 RepID=A0ABS0W814_9ALTE|nr:MULTISPECIES: cation:proton antiporter [Paraglaciecola]AEE24066.1 sodium/hydrogen exchanger [Glaciecola sp. 4H-3-7+YE-5]MBJ2134891.1 cation:proton antiporter [Paraglaciecola chathamensis]MBU3016692.1 cation:proton antiporter [Paraglaciecola agarilytica]GAC10721.1 monovalent cation:H+ antiporter-2, CPA2 family [Paraglaciecola chathamensis S18K6]
MHGIFSNIVILMAVAVASVWLFKRINLPPILAYLYCGILAGPDLLALFEHPEDMQTFAELGVVFLLFSLGLEFSLPKMIAMRQMVFGVGLGQMLLTTVAFMGISMLLGVGLPAAIIVGSIVALSSTAIVIKQTNDMGILNTSRAQMAVSILLFQDLAVVPLLIVVPLLAIDGGQSLGVAISLSIVKGVVVVFILMSVGKWILPRVFTEVAQTRTDELFVLTTILVALMAAGLTYSFGLSMALGAFLAGMMLGESQYKYQLEADIRPFRDILMGLFFITIGMRLNLTDLLAQWHWALLGLGGMLLIKVIIIRLAGGLFGVPKEDAWAAGFKLCQMGEFSFVIAALAVDHNILSTQVGSLILSIGILSMAMTPWLVTRSSDFAKRIVNAPAPALEASETLASQHEQMHDHVIIMGFGRVGQSVSRLLKSEAIPYLVIDADPVRVHESQSAGQPVYFGDVRQKDILRAVGIERAKLVLITFDEHNKAMAVIQLISSLYPDLPIVVRTRKDYRMSELYSAGASQVVPEILEGSLMLVSQVLHLSGIPMSRILKRVRKERKGHYGNMHGFFPGETTELSYEKQDKLEFMHAVVIANNAFAVGKSLTELNITRSGVKVKGLRRDNIELESPPSDTVLSIGDVLVISGKPRRVERAERFLLEGD